MLPVVDEAAIVLGEDGEMEMETSRTYKLHVQQKRIIGLTDELDAVKQAVYKILNTERFQYLLYSWNYGIELKELYGCSIPYVMPNLKSRIKEALMQDDRITDVTDFVFDVQGNTVRAEFTVETIFGQMEENVEVKV